MAASGLGNTTIDNLLKHAFKIASMSQPTHLYVRLCTAAPGFADAISNEVASAYDYTGELNDDWQLESAGKISNTNEIEFATANGGNWGTITHAVAMTTASGAGTLYGVSALSPTRTVNDGETLKFAAGELEIQIVNTLA